MHCANNPVRFVDPDGRDLYLLTGDGRMIIALQTFDEKPDVVYAFNDKENKVESITVNDKELLPQLRSTTTEGMVNATTSNSNDAFNVFKFAADNTSVEWALYKNKNNYTLGTKFDSDRVNSWEDFGIEKTPSLSLHSHPDVNTDAVREEISMGYGPSYKKGHKSLISPSDWGKVRTDVDVNGKQTESKYVYFPNSKRLYHVYYNGPVLIRNVGNDYKKLKGTFK